MNIKQARELKQMVYSAIKHGILTEEDMVKIESVINNRCIKITKELEGEVEDDEKY